MTLQNRFEHMIADQFIPAPCRDFGEETFFSKTGVSVSRPYQGGRSLSISNTDITVVERTRVILSSASNLWPLLNSLSIFQGLESSEEICKIWVKDNRLTAKIPLNTESTDYAYFQHTQL
jgi:hypothetical protein